MKLSYKANGWRFSVILIGAMAGARLQRLFDWFGAVGELPGDTKEERGQKTALLMTASMIALAATIWSMLYVAQDRYISAAIPGGYAIVSAISIVYYAISKRYWFFRFSQIVLILLLPFLLQISLGGFAQGSAVMLWAFLSTVGAAIFYAKFAVPWFLVYEVAILLCAIFDPQIQTIAKPLTPWIARAFWVGNIGGVCAVVFLVTRYAFNRSAAALAEVRAQRLETERAMEKIAEQAEQLKEADKAKTLFFANVSHELRTPLTLLLGPLQSTLQSKTLPDVEQRRLTLAARNGRRLLRQINLLLDFTKAESGKMELELNPENASELLEVLVEEVRPAATARKIEIGYHGPPAPISLEIDRDRLEQAMLNLLGNAIKFTPEGGRIDVSVRAEGESLVIAVQDTGIGIAPDDIPRLFESFQQARSQRQATSAAAMYRQDHQGTGLGLAMAKQIVELHRGRIEVASVLGKGTTFSIYLPLVFTQPAAANVHAVTRSEAKVTTALADLEFQSEEPTLVSAGGIAAVNPVNDTRPRILLVDDHADVRAYLKDLLEDSYRLLQAADGQDGIDMAIREMPDLVISDVMMPRKSGFELVDELKANRKTRVIPIMLLTARGGVEGTVEGLLRGADEYLAKPFDPKELKARVISLLRMTTAEREFAKLYALQKDELEAARVIQESLLPTTSPAIPELDVAGRILTASELGGDFFDFLPLESNGANKRLGIAIGDVTGHGASSALVTAVAKAGLDTHANGNQPSEVVSKLGRVLYDSCKGKRLMTFLYGIVDTDQSTLHYCNAGHLFPWVVNSKTGKVLPLTATGVPLGLPLGLERDGAYHAHQAKLAPGDVLLLFSDGLVEAESKAGQPYGPRRLRQTLEKYRHLPARKLVDTLIDNVMSFSERTAPQDDMTAVIVRRLPSA